MHPSSRPRIAPTAAALLAIALTAPALLGRPLAVGGETADPGPHRSPIALALSADGTRLLTANQTAGSVSLVDTRAAAVLSEVRTGDRPAGVALARDGRHAVVTHWFGGDLALLDVGTDRLEVVGRVALGPEPRGVVLTADGRTAYVAVGASNEVVRVDLDARTVTGRLAVGREPRGIALTPDGSRLLVGNARARGLTVIATGPWRVERTLPIDGDNLRQVALSPDGRTGYVANMKNRGFATTRNNIDMGWVLGQRLSRVALDGSETFATLSLDPQGQAVADAHGVAAGGDGRYLAVGCGGTHEVLLLRADGKPLPWRSGGSRDLIAPDLLRGDGRFRRVALGGRPTELAFAADGTTLYVANYLADAVQVVDAEAGTLVRTIGLGGPAEPSLARRGEILFHDASRSFNQWYSCNTCHSDGHTNGLDFDTLNDGWQDLSTAHLRSRKKVPTLRGVARTGPWTWHGWQTDLDDAVVESYTKSMQGPRPSADEVEAVVAFLQTLDFPPNPYRLPDGGLTPAAGAVRPSSARRRPPATPATAGPS
jgi:YVTN family beta-propeller protein